MRGEVLTALLDGPAHGYEVIRRLEERSGGFWRPSPGSVYPTLQLLDDSGLVRSYEQAGRRTYDLTDDGRTEAEQHAAKGRRSCGGHRHARALRDQGRCRTGPEGRHAGGRRWFA